MKPDKMSAINMDKLPTEREDQPGEIAMRISKRNIVYYYDGRIGA